jgi:hypothetical protein
VHRNRVGAEGVEDDEIVGLVGRMLQADSRVAQDDVHSSTAVLQIGKVTGISGDLLDERIDFVEGPQAIGFRVAGHRTAAETDHGHVLQAAGLRRDQLTDRTRRMVVPGRITAVARRDLLTTVCRASMLQQMIRVIRSIDDSMDAEEAARGKQNSSRGGRPAERDHGHKEQRYRAERLGRLAHM